MDQHATLAASEQVARARHGLGRAEEGKLHRKPHVELRAASYFAALAPSGVVPNDNAELRIPT